MAPDPELPSGETVDVFKSWAERRPTQPKQILAERRFQHPVLAESWLQESHAGVAAGAAGRTRARRHLLRPLIHARGPELLAV
jgi:hypothetical protein